MKNIKIKLTPRQIKNYTNIAVFIIIISSITYTSIFLYKNFYLVITQSEEIMILQQKISTGSINIKKFNEIIKNLNKKENPKNNPEIKNPFK